MESDAHIHDLFKWQETVSCGSWLCVTICAWFTRPCFSLTWFVVIYRERTPNVSFHEWLQAFRFKDPQLLCECQPDAWITRFAVVIKYHTWYQLPFLKEQTRKNCASLLFHHFWSKTHKFIAIVLTKFRDLSKTCLVKNPKSDYSRLLFSVRVLEPRAVHVRVFPCTYSWSHSPLPQHIIARRETQRSLYISCTSSYEKQKHRGDCVWFFCEWRDWC